MLFRSSATVTILSIPEVECRPGPHLTGTRLFQACLPHYKATGPSSYSEMVCGEDGVWKWVHGSHLTCIAECGLPRVSVKGHIVNGTTAESNNWPWNAAIFKRSGDQFLYLCGATLITSSALITAAHCVDGTAEDLRVVLAPVSSVWSVNANHAHTQILEHLQIHVHDGYNPTTFEADIAVLKIGNESRAIELTDYVYPACFPFPGRENKQIERYQTSPANVGIVTGFGTDESFQISKTLREVRLPVVSVRDCFKVLDLFPLTTQLCAGYTNGTSVCNGDSGSGLLFQEEGARKLYFIQGIASHGQQGGGAGGRWCDYNRYSVFTRVGAFSDWVELVVGLD